MSERRPPRKAKEVALRQIKAMSVRGRKRVKTPKESNSKPKKCSVVLERPPIGTLAASTSANGSLPKQKYAAKTAAEESTSASKIEQYADIVDKNANIVAALSPPIETNEKPKRSNGIKRILLREVTNPIRYGLVTDESDESDADGAKIKLEQDVDASAMEIINNVKKSSTGHPNVTQRNLCGAKRQVSVRSVPDKKPNRSNDKEPKTTAASKSRALVAENVTKSILLREITNPVRYGLVSPPHGIEPTVIKQESAEPAPLDDSTVMTVVPKRILVREITNPVQYGSASRGNVSGIKQEPLQPTVRAEYTWSGK